MLPSNKDPNGNTFYYKPFRYLPEKAIANATPENASASTEKQHEQKQPPNINNRSDWGSNDTKRKQGDFGG